MSVNASKRRVWLAVLAIFLVAAGVRFSFWSQIRHTALDRWQRFDQSDMATYVEQAQRIAKGDLLQSDPYHPYHSWQTVAPAQKWHRSTSVCRPASASRPSDWSAGRRWSSNRARLAESR